jgi:hypothetical protein
MRRNQVRQIGKAAGRFCMGEWFAGGQADQITGMLVDHVMFDLETLKVHAFFQMRDRR